MTRVLLSLLARRLMRNSKSGNIPNVGQMNLKDDFFFPTCKFVVLKRIFSEAQIAWYMCNYNVFLFPFLFSIRRIFHKW